MFNYRLELAIGSQSILDDAIALNYSSQELYRRFSIQTYPLFLDSDWSDLWDVYWDFDDLFDTVQNDYPDDRVAVVPPPKSVAEESIETANDILDLAHDEDIEAWTSSIADLLRSNGGFSSFQALLPNISLTKGELLLALLMGNFYLSSRGDFYGDDIMIETKDIEFILVAKVPVCVRATDDSHCLYEAYRSPYGKHEGSQYQKGDRFVIKQERVNEVVVIDSDNDWILIPNSELSCFDRIEDGGGV
jgi:hypothetical protein